MGYLDLVESRIREAMEAGAFDNLKGAGKPLPDRRHEQLAGDDWMGFHILQNGGMLPAWLGLAREIEHELTLLERIRERARHVISAAAASPDWSPWRRSYAAARADFEAHARRVRRKQDRFNFDAPSIGVERPALWVEFELEKLDAEARAAGAPPAWFDARSA